MSPSTVCVTFEETPDADSDSHLDQLMFFLVFFVYHHKPRSLKLCVLNCHKFHLSHTNMPRICTNCHPWSWWWVDRLKNRTSLRFSLSVIYLPWKLNTLYPAITYEIQKFTCESNNNPDVNAQNWQNLSQFDLSNNGSHYVCR